MAGYRGMLVIPESPGATANYIDDLMGSRPERSRATITVTSSDDWGGPSDDLWLSLAGHRSASLFTPRFPRACKLWRWIGLDLMNCHEFNGAAKFSPKTDADGYTRVNMKMDVSGIAAKSLVLCGHRWPFANVRHVIRESV